MASRDAQPPLAYGGAVRPALSSVQNRRRLDGRRPTLAHRVIRQSSTPRPISPLPTTFMLELIDLSGRTPPDHSAPDPRTPPHGTRAEGVRLVVHLPCPKPRPRGGALG